MADPVKIIRRLGALKGQRQPHEAGWAECLDYTFPERGHGINSQIITPEDAQKKQNKILDDTAADSSRILAANLVTGTTPANSIWLGLDFGDVDADSKRWADDSAKTIFENIHQSDFDAAAYEFALDMSTVGWSVLYVDENPEGGYHFEQWPLGECYPSASRSGGIIDTIYREFELTVEQVVSTYGFDKCSKQVQDAYTNEKYDDKIKVCWNIEPRRMYVPNARRSVHLPFESCHIEVNTKHLLRESGYHEFPCVVPRWLLIPGTNYAKGPLAQALGAIRTLNDIKALELMALDIAAGGMWVGVDDGVLNPRTVKLGGRKLIVANDVDSIKELKTSADFNVTFTSEDRLQAQIRKIMLADQLQPQDGPAMTATEVHVRVQMIRQLLGPIYGRLQAEYLQRLVERCFGLAYRAGVLGEAPEAIRQRPYTVKYLSPFARAQKLEDVTAMDRLELTLMQEAQADPSVLDMYDFEAAVQLRADNLGVPNKVIRNEAAIKKLRANREAVAKQKQQETQSAQLTQTAGEAMINRAAAA